MTDFIRKNKANFSRDLYLFTDLLVPEEFFVKNPRRNFKSYPDFKYSIRASQPEKLRGKIQQLSKRFDKINGIIYGKLGFTGTYFKIDKDHNIYIN